LAYESAFRVWEQQFKDRGEDAPYPNGFYDGWKARGEWDASVVKRLDVQVGCYYCGGEAVNGQGGAIYVRVIDPRTMEGAVTVAACRACWDTNHGNVGR